MMRLYLSKEKHLVFERYNSPLAEAFAKAGLEEELDCALFWDCPSLFQPERTEEQTVLFRAGLKASNFWYGHSRTVVWMQSALPEGFAERMRGLGLAEDYDNSGWHVSPRTQSRPMAAPPPPPPPAGASLRRLGARS